MSVSYVSQTFKNSPYVPPVDLNLLTQVLSYQQGKFDTNALAIQSKIDQLSTLDVAKDEDRQYLNNKINNLVNNLNSLGGVNLRDENVSNSIQSYASDIYSDPNVVNAVSSSKRIRNLQASYEKYRTDPKLSKFYSDANYTLDMANVQSYMADGQVGSSYQGNSSATPFYDYNKDFRDIFKGLESNKYSKVYGSNYYLNKETKEYVSQQDVAEEARGLMSSNARAQMGRDATYLYKYKAGYGKEQVVNKALEVDNKELYNIENKIRQTQEDIALETDPKNKAILKNNLFQYQGQRNTKAQDIEANRYAYSRLYDTNPDELMYKGFSDDYFQALGLRYSYSKNENSISADPVKAMFFNANEHRYLKQADINAAKDLLNTRLGAERENLILRLKAEGKLDANGKLIGGAAGVPDIIPNTDPNKEEGYYNAAKQRAEVEIPAEAAGYMQDFWDKLVATNPSELSGMQSDAYDFNKDGKVNLQDFIDQQDITKNPNKETLPSMGQNVLNIINKAIIGYKAASAGQNINVSEFPEGTSEMVENLNLLNFEKQSLSKGIQQYESGQRGFFRDIYNGELLSADEKVQGSPSVSTIKSYLMVNKGVTAETPSQIRILKAGRNPNGAPNSFGVWYSVKDDSPVFAETTPEVARLAGITAGPYDVLNGNVREGNDFRTSVQNVKDGRFVGNIRVYKYGNKYRVQYLQFNPKINDSQGLDMGIPEQDTPALAYKAASDLIKNYEIQGIPAGQYKEAFEDILTNKKYKK